MVNPIQTIKTNIHNRYYTYVPGEFLPIYSGTELINKKAFHLYKTKRAVARIHRHFAQALQTAKA